MNAHQMPHSGRNLLAHLEGTWQLLRKFGSRDEVCTAGLFHSVYGTHTFAPECVSLRNRESVAHVIGEGAERLVYLFATSSRPETFLDATRTGALRQRFTGEATPVDSAVLRDLMEIECANLIEQGMGRQFMSRLLSAVGEEENEFVGARVIAYIRQHIELLTTSQVNNSGAEPR